MNIWTVAALVLLINLPFGRWRARAKTFALPWLLAVHVPIAFVVVLHVLSGLGWRLITFPVLIGAFFAGQFLGGQLYLWWRR